MRMKSVEGGRLRVAPRWAVSRLAALWLAGLVSLAALWAQEAPGLTSLKWLTNGELQLQLLAPGGTNYFVETATQLTNWIPFLTLTGAGTGTNQVTDSGAPYFATRLYRARLAEPTETLTGDHWMTDAGDVVIHPINHASFVLGWEGKLIYNDPVGGATPYKNLARADLILISHIHGDHFDTATLNAVKQANSIIIAPAAVYSSLPMALKTLTIPLANGGQTNVLGLTIEAVPAYNSYHPKGSGNGYVVTFGSRRMLMTGDTGKIPELQSLPNIDVAFVCMNIPYTMTVAEAVTTVRSFQPRVVYPYHYQGYAASDLTHFKQQVGTDLGIEVRLRKWY